MRCKLPQYKKKENIKEKGVHIYEKKALRTQIRKKLSAIAAAYHLRANSSPESFIWKFFFPEE